MLCFWAVLLLVTTFQVSSGKLRSLDHCYFWLYCLKNIILIRCFVFGSAGYSRAAQDVVLSKNQALSFYKRFIGDNNIDEECYGEESCDFEEVVEKFDHSEQTVGRPCLDKNGALEYLLLNLSSIPL